MRDYLAAHGVEFDDRNIRSSEAARAELEARSGTLVVPQVVYGQRVVVGFDPEGLDEVVRLYRADRT